ncbi:MAG TPA: HAMP domain-containing histidine kinase [Candidatus Mediterraneibacter merdigallinarum]|nr:HAMP domain-containing histidine kinase [Candidatus Mediterraneibacter merdigallinarum]
MYFKLAGLLLAAVAVSGLFFVVINYAGEQIITKVFSDSSHIEKLSEAYIQDLQDYIDETKAASNDSEKLTEWVRKRKIVSIQVYKDEILTYDSNYPDAAVEDAEAEGAYYDWEYYYTAEFADGTADVFLYGFFSYPLYSYAMTAEILLAVILLVAIVILGIRKPVRYIGRLKAECEILGSGDLDYQVTVQGKDELSLLARGLDNMRMALRESNEKEAELTAANRRMITEMSHDLRTPLTSLLIYTEILGKKAAKDPRQAMEYVRKIEKKARQIKRLSDNIFEYALITEETKAELGEPQTLRELFYDPLSEMTAYLGERGYTVELRPDTGSGSERRQIRVNEEYINRIMDNIVSNIEKYADKSMPVRIETIYTEEYGGLAFRNGISCSTEDRRKTEGNTNIGLHNVEKMMKNMDGYFRVKQTENIFEITLIFPWVKEK